MISRLFNFSVRTKIIILFLTLALAAMAVVVVIRASQMQAQTDLLLTERLQNNANMTFGIIETVQNFTLWMLDLAEDYAYGGLTDGTDITADLFNMFSSMNVSMDGVLLFENIMVFDHEFNLVAMGNPDGDIVNLGFFYTKDSAISLMERVSAAYENPESGALQILFTRPVMGYGRSAGTVAIITNIHALKFFQRDFMQVYDSFVNVADSSGIIFFSNRPAYVGRRVDELGVVEAFGEIPMNTLFRHSSALTGIDKIAYVTWDPSLNWTIISFFDAHAVQSTAFLVFISLLPTVVGVLIAVASAAFIVHRSLSPLRDLANSAGAVARGDIHVTFKHDKDDEIGQVSDSFMDILRALVILGNNFKSAEKAMARGDTEYNLSDTRLGGVFDEMLDRTDRIVKHVQASMFAVVEQHEKVIEQHVLIMDSITYSQKIQRNMLPTHRAMLNAFPGYSVIWSPRDVVGGDIYWTRAYSDGVVLCVCDCTGHGTPGALLTMLVISTLEGTVRNYNFKDTADIMWEMEKRFTHVFSTGEDERKLGNSDIRDGCDMAVLFIANDGGVTFSSGNMNIFVTDGKEVKRHRGQRVFIGEGNIKSKQDIQTFNIPPNPDNKFYIATDGLFDQPGGEKSSPFGYTIFTDIILENHEKSPEDISDLIWQAFEEYRGGEPRVDDVTLVTFNSPKELY